MITPVIVAPGQKQVIPLPPEFVQAQDGHEKHDCELAAAKRWLINWGSHYAPRKVTVLGDDLYCHQPFCQQFQIWNLFKFNRLYFSIFCGIIAQNSIYSGSSLQARSFLELY